MTYRILYVDFWKDPKIMEEMTPEDRYFYLYLLTNPNTTSTGIYTISKKQMALELGYTTETVNALMDRFINHHKLIRYNCETREVALKNWGKYNLGKGGKPVMDCLTKELGLVKDKALICYVAESIKSETILRLYEKFYDTSTIRERIVPRQVGNTETGEETETKTKKENYTKTEKETYTENKTQKEIHEVEENEIKTIINNHSVNSVVNPEDEEVLSLSNYYKIITGDLEGLNLGALRVAIKQHKSINVKKAIDRALASNKLSMSYINGILRNWEKEGYPMDEEGFDETRTPRQGGKLVKFNDYPQRQYDYDDLEKKLLGWIPG